MADVQVHVCAWSVPAYGADGWFKLCVADVFRGRSAACSRKVFVEEPQQNLRRFSAISLEAIREAPGPAPEPLPAPLDCEYCDDAGFVAVQGKAVPCPRCTPPPPVAIGVPDVLASASFTSWSYKLNDTLAMAQAFNRCLAISHGGASTALLNGPPGRGKSHLAAAALHDSTWPKPGLWIVWGNFWAEMRRHMFGSIEDHWTEDSMLKPLMLLKGLLVIDDVGAGDGGTPASQQRLYTVVEARYAARLPMILTTNNLSMVEDRVISRLADGGAGLITCDGPNDVRRKKV